MNTTSRMQFRGWLPGRSLAALGAMMLALCLAGQAWAQSSGAIKDPERARYYDLYKGKRVVFVPVFMGLDLTEAWSRIMQLQAERLGYDYEVRNANFDTSAGVQILTQLLTEDPRPDVVVIQNPDVTSYAKMEKKLEEAGIQVVQMNMKSLHMTTGFAGGDATIIGEMQAQSVVDHCGPDTSRKVLILNGPTTAPWTVYLQEGYNNVFAQHPEMQIVARQSVGNYESSKAKSITEVTLKQHPDLCAVIGVWDIPDMGTAAAIAQEGKTGQVFLSTNGGFSDYACKAIQEDKFNNYISFNVPGQGRDVNNLIQMALQSPYKAGELKVALYSPLMDIGKDDLKDKRCWSLETVHQ